MNSKHQSVIGIFLILAATWMSVGGVVNAATLDVPTSFTTIQAAIDVAVDGDIVRVAPGTYFENLTLENNTITLTSHFIDSGDTSFIDQTIIDGGGFSNNVIFVKSSVGVGTTIQGFTIRNGNNGVDIQGPLQFLYNRVTGTRDAVDYAASTSNTFAGLVKNCEIDNNNDDAVDLDGPVSVTIEDSYLHDNGDDGIEVRLTSHNFGLEINVFNNIIENNAEDGIQLIQLAGVVSDRVFRIEGNLIIDNAFAGIGLSTETTQNFEGANLEERVHVTNNTFVRNDHGISGGNNLIALNNLFVNTTNIALKRVDDTSIAAFNLFFGNGQDFSESEVDLISSVFQDPLLNANDEITSSSPAVDVGTAFYQHNSEVVLNIPSNAFNGTAPDMGHVETDGTTSNQAPTVDTELDQSIVFPNNANINATVTDDGLPTPPNLTVSWTQESGPATATIFTPNAEDTEISFPTEGNYIFRLTANDSALSTFDEITIDVTSSGGSTTTLWIPITTGIDDVEEKSSQTVIIGSPDLDLVRSGGNQTVGLRFNGLNIPQGAAIVNAYIQFTASGIRSESTSLTIEGEAAANAAVFVKVDGNVSSRSKTTANVLWPPSPWTAIGEAGVNQQTPPITSIIQEIVDHPNWTSNNSAAIIITGTGKRDAHSFEGNQASAPVLHVEFTDATGNQPPTATISAPTDGASFTVGDNITFTGTGTDPEDGDVTASLTWNSNLDGAIGTGGSFSITTLSEGAHTITTTATDNGSMTGSDAISITITAVGNTPPTALISAPANGASFTVGDNISFTGIGTDPEDGNVTAGLTWDSNLDGAIGTGGFFSTTALTEGTHTITATAIDSGSMTGSDAISITITAVGNTPPTALISAPANGTNFTVGDNISFTGTGTDPEDGDVTAGLTWDSNLDGAIGTGGTFSTTLSEGTHTITVTATDSGNMTGSDTITVTVLPTGGETTILSIPITAGIDDVEEKSSQTVIIGSPDLDLVRSGGDQTVGLRFNGLNIPPGAAIVNAYIQFTASGIRSESTSLTIEGEAVANPAVFVKVNGNVSSRSRTTANVSWPPLPWTAIGEAGINQQTPAITSIIQEIVDHPNWASNNSAAIIITGTGKRDAHSFEGNQASAPVLHVEFADATGNQPPTALISAPADGSSFTIGDNITFTGTATDPEDGDVTTSLTWNSNLDGAINTGGSFSTIALSQGTHMITATATDSGNMTGSDTISITVAAAGNTPPAALISAPVDGASFTVGDNITFTGTGMDPEDGDVTTSLTWDSNFDGAIGTGGSFSTTLSEGTHTITATATDSGSMTGLDTITITVLPPGGGTTTIAIPINSGSDDAEEKPAGNVIIGSIDIDLVASGGNQTVGMRFNNVTIPQGSTIVNAFIQFTASGAGSTVTTLTLEGETADNATTFVNNINGNISTRPRTVASVPWSPFAWTTVGEADVDQRTPDLTAIVQEIVNQSNWVSNNSLAIIVTGSGKRDADAFEANPSTAPVLHLEYQ
jgi:hypothetical protein